MGILKAERRGKQHVALSALAGDWRLATNTESTVAEMQSKYKSMLRNCVGGTD